MSRLSNRGFGEGTEKESLILLLFHPVAARVAIRGASQFSRPQPRTNDFGSRVILGITHDHNAPSTGFNLVALGYGLRRVVGALGMKIRTNFTNDGTHVPFRKNHDGVNVRERRQYLRAFGSGHHGPPLTLQRTHGRISIHGDNQLASEFPGGVQVAHMANVQQIETSVRERDAIASAPPICRQFQQLVARNNFLME